MLADRFEEIHFQHRFVKIIFEEEMFGAWGGTLEMKISSSQIKMNNNCLLSNVILPKLILSGKIIFSSENVNEY